VEQALDVIDFNKGPVEPQQPSPTDKPYIERLVECDQFVLDRWRLKEPQTIGGDNRCHLVSIIEGSIVVRDDPANRPLNRGEAILLPAACGSVELTPLGNSVFIDAYLP
jgi:mannose-6-phosphate isomerase